MSLSVQTCPIFLEYYLFMVQRAYYRNKISAFLEADSDVILGELSRNNLFSLEIQQKNAWLVQIVNLKQQLRSFPDGQIFFEFSIPRMGKRLDALLLIGGVIFVIEYKVGAKTHDRYAIDQTVDYALDLKNFHEGSHNKCIVPILVSTKANKESPQIRWSTDCVSSPLLSVGSDLGLLIQRVLSDLPFNACINANEWANSGYKPTPTIVEAAQALYRGHSVG